MSLWTDTIYAKPVVVSLQATMPCYKGCHSGVTQKILLMPVRGAGIRDVAEIEKISIQKVLSVLVNSRHLIQP
jgi:transposase-like protein